jgi:hypothetical protein
VRVLTLHGTEDEEAISNTLVCANLRAGFPGRKLGRPVEAQENIEFFLFSTNYFATS